MFPFEAMLLFVLQLQEQIMPSFSVATSESKETKIPINIRTTEFFLFFFYNSSTLVYKLSVITWCFYFHILRCNNKDPGNTSSPKEKERNFISIKKNTLCLLTGNQGYKIYRGCGVGLKCVLAPLHQIPHEFHKLLISPCPAFFFFPFCCCTVPVLALRPEAEVLQKIDKKSEQM